ncbi:MAG: hypothetical protein PHD71_02780 [Methanospirillum sp.]|nr:hypothetical protein [Methanospirillum sp.]
MILIVDLTDPDILVLFDEFVSPIQRIVHQCGYENQVVRIESVKIPPSCTGIIICGTALADTWYRSHHLMSLLNGWTGPILGICAGMQMLLTETGGETVFLTDIGMISIRSTDMGRKDILLNGKDEFSGYALHKYTATLSSHWIALAISDITVQMVKHCSNSWYGALFHPEVRNEWIIERFAALTMPPDYGYE